MLSEHYSAKYFIYILLLNEIKMLSPSLKKAFNIIPILHQAT
jgi:hypothetical protein